MLCVLINDDIFTDCWTTGTILTCRHLTVASSNANSVHTDKWFIKPQAINEIYISNPMCNFISSILLHKTPLIFEQGSKVLSRMFILTTGSTF